MKAGWYLSDMKTAKSAVMHFTLRDDGIVWVESQPGIEPTAQLLDEAEAACRTIRGGVKRPALWSIRDLTKPKPEAWVKFIQNAPNNLTAIGVVGYPEQLEILGAFPDRMNTMLLPFRLFDDEGPALEWLAGFVDSETNPADFSI